MNDYITVYVDGSCSNNGHINAKGGIGIHFPNSELKDISKQVPLETCTNQKSELYAILFCIKYLVKYLGLIDKELVIKTDSEYSINCITKWANNWVINGWKKKNGEDVINKNYIEPIYKLYKKYNISFQHIPAHTGNIDDDSIGNEIADCLAKKAIDLKPSKKITEEIPDKKISRTVSKKKNIEPEFTKKISRTVSNKKINSNKKNETKKKEIKIEFVE
jgi:ribonuclease HI